MIANGSITRVKYNSNRSIEPPPVIEGPSLWTILLTVAFLLGIAIIIAAFVYQIGTSPVAPSTLAYPMIAIFAYVVLFILVMRFVNLGKDRGRDHVFYEQLLNLGNSF